jgi:hypothetical protein
LELWWAVGRRSQVGICSGNWKYYLWCLSIYFLSWCLL